MSESLFGLRQDSPAARRILHRLQTQGPATRYRLAIECHINQHHAAGLMRRLVEVGGLLHVSAWTLPESGHGPFTPVYAHGPGADAVKPAGLTNAEKGRLRRKRLKERFGSRITHRICRSRNEGGAAAIIIDGITVYRRGKGVVA